MSKNTPPKPAPSTASQNKQRMREFIAGADAEYMALQKQMHELIARASRSEVEAHQAAGFTREEAIALVARK